jgi:hypothetical protein
MREIENTTRTRSGVRAAAAAGQDALVAHSSPPCRIPTCPAPSAEPASPTSAIAWSSPSPPRRIHFTAATNSSATPSTIGRFPASSTTASRRPFNATVAGDSNQGRQRPQRPATRLQPQRLHRPRLCHRRPPLTRTVRLRERYKLKLVAESFNLFNRDNQRLAITSNGPDLFGLHIRTKLRHRQLRPLPAITNYRPTS